MSGAKEDQVIRKYIADEISKMNRNLNQIVLRIEDLDNKGKKDVKSEPKWDPKIWGNFKSNRPSQQPLPSVKPGTPWVLPDEGKARVFNDLNKSIDTQQKLLTK